jgi:hypothetical protein
MNDTIAVLTVGSRRGAVFALVFFVVWAGVLGFGVQALMRKRGVGATLARVTGALLALLVIGGAYATMVAGFYTVRVEPRALALESLLPSISERLETRNIQGVEAIPWGGRGRWRFVVRLSNGEMRRSAPTSSELARTAVRAFRGAPPAEPSGAPVP